MKTSEAAAKGAVDTGPAEQDPSVFWSPESETEMENLFEERTSQPDLANFRGELARLLAPGGRFLSFYSETLVRTEMLFSGSRVHLDPTHPPCLL